MSRADKLPQTCLRPSWLVSLLEVSTWHSQKPLLLLHSKKFDGRWWLKLRIIIIIPIYDTTEQEILQSCSLLHYYYPVCKLKRKICVIFLGRKLRIISIVSRMSNQISVELLRASSNLVSSGLLLAMKSWLIWRTVVTC